jgi:hypothetical protein
MRLVFLETARDERARGVLTREEIVVATGSVDERVRGDVKDGAVDR